MDRTSVTTRDALLRGFLRRHSADAPRLKRAVTAAAQHAGWVLFAGLALGAALGAVAGILFT